MKRSRISRAQSGFWRLARDVALMGALLVLLAQTPVSAAERDCANAEAQTDMTLCAVDQFRAADAKLRRVYEQVAKKIRSTEGTARLREAQKAWAAYRDKQCDFETVASEGGSIHPMVVAQCRTAFTYARIKELERQLSCEEYDPTCAR